MAGRNKRRTPPPGQSGQAQPKAIFGQFPPVRHLQEYLNSYRSETGRLPQFVKELRADEDYTPVDLVYPLDEAVFVHIRPLARGLGYHVIEPILDDDDREVFHRVKQKLFGLALYRRPPENQEQLESELLTLFDEVTSRRRSDLVQVEPDRVEALKYYLIRDIARYGPLQPFTLDPYLEDIQAVGTHPIHVIHKDFDMLKTNVRFDSQEQLDVFVRNLSERMGRPVSDSRPIVDATLGDGSRINIVYSEDVSRMGPSFSIRRVHENPISVTQLISWGTLSPQIAAYIWLCLENGMSVFVCGEAACGKSATLNAFLSFIDPRSKLYSAEDTPEVRPPHPVWQRLLTREVGPVEARVEMFDLLKAALRSRPNYIVVGEIRGAEGAVAFQAMQTGHPTVATFHATDKVKMIQRLSAPPISIPLTFMDNLNVAVFQQAFHKHGRLIRRVTSVDEIQGYSELDGGIITLPVFEYKANSDSHDFKGYNNSFVLERKIAEAHGYEDPGMIYEVLERRALILQGLVDHGVMGFNEVNKILFEFVDKGEAALPFKLPGEPPSH